MNSRPSPEKSTVFQPQPLAILLPDPRRIPAVVELLFAHPLAISADFGVGAPLFKATPALAQAHKAARGARERFTAYFELGLLDEAVRVQVAERFAAQYRQRHGRGERRDVFLASGDIVKAAVQLRPLRALDFTTRDAVVERVRAHPHDKAVLDRELGLAGGPLGDEGGGAADATVYALELKIFVDNIYNPGRLKDLAVVAALQQQPLAEPVVLEFWAHPAMAGYGGGVVEGIARSLQLPCVWLEYRNALR